MACPYTEPIDKGKGNPAKQGRDPEESGKNSFFINIHVTLIVLWGFHLKKVQAAAGAEQP